MRPSRFLYAGFVVSGMAGLVYEALWARYLGLYVGHGAYAQVLVLVVYLGGMAVGSFIVADFSERVRRPLSWYAGAEATLAAFGFTFHWVFRWAASLSYDVIFPALGSAGLVGSVRWGVAGAMILPQAMILGATFPLMAASVVRRDEDRPGRGVASVYVLNTLGGAAGVLLAGFWMIGALGLPGTSMAAGALNLAAAALVLVAARRVPDRPSALDAPAAETRRPAGAVGPWAARPRALGRLLLLVSFGTAFASFAYEIGWTRMLALVLGSATHAFELMLSAFILGLAGGAWWIRERSDASRDPVRLLGVIQVLMGVTAVVSIPLFYFVSFHAIAWLVPHLSGRAGGYSVFNLARYALCLLVMLPATVLAGMTLPVIVGSLLRAGIGEAAIGRIYGANTVGSVVGAALAGLVALPFLGLKGLVLAGAALDAGLGLVLLARSAGWSRDGWRRAVLAALVGAAAISAVGFGVRLDDIVLGSGVYRLGDLPEKGDRVGLFYADGRTATVSAHLLTKAGAIVLATNGKPDASITLRWLADERDTVPDRPIERGTDFTTQVLAPAVALAYRPDAHSVANIGHGSGMSATTFLTSDALQRLVTIEIEPLMVEGSLVFLPANRPAISDPRSTYVFDDAKSYFAYRKERFDVVFAEPSNPWVSGTSSLFTEEFYRRATSVMADGGIFAQWMQIYELNDDLFLSVLAALDAVFPSYRAYLVGDADVAIVARADGSLGPPDWSVLASPGFRHTTEGAPDFRPEQMESLLLFDETTFRPLLERGVQPNSDYRPILDLGAEHARFDQTIARGIYSLATSRINLVRELNDERVGPRPYAPAPAYGLPPVVYTERAAWLRADLSGDATPAPEAFPDWENARLGLQTLLLWSRGDAPPDGWAAWAAGFDDVEEQLHWGTSGWADTTFYRTVYDFLDRADAPPPVRAAVDLRHAFALHDWPRAASAADVLLARAAQGETWLRPEVLRDVAVLAYLHADRPSAARTALNRLAARAGPTPSNARIRLLEALVDRAEEKGG